MTWTNGENINQFGQTPFELLVFELESYFARKSIQRYILDAVASGMFNNCSLEIKNVMSK